MKESNSSADFSFTVGTLIYRLLGHLALNPQCQDRMHEEAVQALEHWNALNDEHEQAVRLRHRKLMVYTEASIMEALRLASSPIVPHVATQNATIGGQCRNVPNRQLTRTKRVFLFK